MFGEGGDGVVIHTEVLPLGVKVPGALGELQVGSKGGGGEFAGLVFVGGEELEFAVEIGAPVGGGSDAEALFDSVAYAAGPVAVLVGFGEAARVGGGGIDELEASVEASEGRVDFGACESERGYGRIVAVGGGDAWERVHGV